MHNLSDDHVKSASSIYQQLDLEVSGKLSSPCPSSLLLQASITKQIMAPHPSPQDADQGSSSLQPL
jgi:hypothetical protein